MCYFQVDNLLLDFQKESRIERAYCAECTL